MNHAEQVFYAHLTEVDSLDVIAREGFSSEETREVIPTELGRDITAWVLDLYFASGKLVAPTREAIETTWGDEMEKVDITIEDDVETDTIEWAISELRSLYAQYTSQQFVKEFARAITEAPPTAKVVAIKEYAGKLYYLSQLLTSRRQEEAADQGLEDALRRYDERAIANTKVSGMSFGIPEIDQHTMGIHEGELAIFAAYSGVGKSWVANKVSFAEWKRGRRTVLFTLENDLAMTFDRMACMQARIPYELWQQGRVDEGALIRAKAVLEQLKASEHAPIVIMPDRPDRDPVSLVRKAYALDAESVIIDQLSFVERVPGSQSRQNYEIVGEKVKEIKNLISENRTPLPCLLLHQINRVGNASAKKSGKYEMTHMADSPDVERTADFVFSAFQGERHREENSALWQMLKARRTPLKHWLMSWRLDVGDIRVRSEVSLDG